MNKDMIIKKLIGEMVGRFMFCAILAIIALGGISTSFLILFVNCILFIKIIIFILLIIVFIYILCVVFKEVNLTILDYKLLKKGVCGTIVGRIVGLSEVSKDDAGSPLYSTIIQETKSGTKLSLTLINHYEKRNVINGTDKDYIFYYVPNTKIAYCPDFE